MVSGTNGLVLRRIAVFCGSRGGANAAYTESAQVLGAALAARQIGLIYGGGGVGMMGRLAATVRNAGGQSLGIIPKALLVREVGNPDLGELRVVRSMHERKAIMAELADGFIALPGGFGTFEELCEIVTWAQLGLHSKPIGLLNTAGYFDPLIAMFDRAIEEGFTHPDLRRLILDDVDPSGLLDRMAVYEPPAVERWIDSAET